MTSGQINLKIALTPSRETVFLVNFFITQYLTLFCLSVQLTLAFSPSSFVPLPPPKNSILFFCQYNSFPFNLIFMLDLDLNLLFWFFLLEREENMCVICENMKCGINFLYEVILLIYIYRFASS